jgi:toxin ParE1/3/4
VAQLEVGFTFEALADIDQAFLYYAERAETRVAVRFLRRLDEAFERIAVFPKSCPIYSGDARRLVVRGFPYWIYYRERADAIEVFAVLHTKRDSSRIDWDNR